MHKIFTWMMLAACVAGVFWCLDGGNAGVAVLFTIAVGINMATLLVIRNNEKRELR